MAVLSGAEWYQLITVFHSMIQAQRGAANLNSQTLFGSLPRSTWARAEKRLRVQAKLWSAYCEHLAQIISVYIYFIYWFYEARFLSLNSCSICNLYSFAIQFCAERVGNICQWFMFTDVVAKWIWIQCTLSILFGSEEWAMRKYPMPGHGCVLLPFFSVPAIVFILPVESGSYVMNSFTILSPTRLSGVYEIVQTTYSDKLS